MTYYLNDKLLNDIKNKYGEAFYILDSNQFINNFIELKNSFSNIYPNFNIAYSYKTNYIPKLCKIVNNLGGYAEVVSEMEVELALKVGVKPHNIIWNGPIKNTLIIEKFLINGGIINIDSIEEMEIIRNIVLNNINHFFNLGIRCNFDVNDGIISRFGFDVNGNEFSTVVSFIKNTPNIIFNNLHCHFAKRNIEYWPTRAQNIISVINKIGVIPKRIDLGGGLFGKMPDSLKKQFSSQIPSYYQYAKAVCTIFIDKFGENGPELIIEPGTALVGDCMSFVGTVKTIKNIRGKYFASVLGSQKNLSMNGINPPIEIISLKNKQLDYDSINFVGFTCIEDDVLYNNYSGKLGVGDMIVFHNCGSYSIVMKPPFILPNFPVLDLSNNQIEEIKRPETFEDIFRTYHF